MTTHKLTKALFILITIIGVFQINAMTETKGKKEKEKKFRDLRPGFPVGLDKKTRKTIKKVVEDLKKQSEKWNKTTNETIQKFAQESKKWNKTFDETKKEITKLNEEIKKTNSKIPTINDIKKVGGSGIFLAAALILLWNGLNDKEKSQLWKLIAAGSSAIFGGIWWAAT